MSQYNISVMLCIIMVVHCPSSSSLVCEQKGNFHLQTKCLGVVKFRLDVLSFGKINDQCQKKFPNGRQLLTFFSKSYASCDDQDSQPSTETNLTANFILDFTNSDDPQNTKDQGFEKLEYDEIDDNLSSTDFNNRSAVDIYGDICRLVKVSHRLIPICELHTPCMNLKHVHLSQICIYDNLDKHCSNYHVNGTCSQCKSHDKTGTYCQTTLSRRIRSVDPCDPNPCENGGTCRLNESIAICECAKGYDGENCTTNVDLCSPNPCENGGICRQNRSSVVCKCPTGYDGENCTTSISLSCGTNNPCLNNGVCFIDNNVFKCRCLYGFTGELCETAIKHRLPMNAFTKKLIFGLLCIILFICIGLIIICVMSRKMDHEKNDIKSPAPECSMSRSPDISSAKGSPVAKYIRKSPTNNSKTPSSSATSSSDKKHRLRKIKLRRIKKSPKPYPHYIEVKRK